jgi:hypothetical protein
MVLGSFMAGVGLFAYLLVTVWQQNEHLDERVNEQIEKSDRIAVVVDRSVRIPLCTFLYVALTRPLASLSPEQAEARPTYVLYYGAGTSEKPGLNCPDALPPEASGG